MKKRLLKNAMLRKRIWLRKMFLRMNYLFCLLVLGALSVSAEVYSQNGLVSLKMKDVSLVKVFNEITKQTGYDFLYNYDLIQNKGTVDVNAKMVDLKDFLHDLLKGKNLGFEFRGFCGRFLHLNTILHQTYIAICPERCVHSQNCSATLQAYLRLYLSL